MSGIGDWRSDDILSYLGRIRWADAALMVRVCHSSDDAVTRACLERDHAMKVGNWHVVSNVSTFRLDSKSLLHSVERVCAEYGWLWNSNNRLLCATADNVLEQERFWSRHCGGHGTFSFSRVKKSRIHKMDVPYQRAFMRQGPT